MNFIKTADPLASLIETSPAIDVWKDNGAPSMASTSDISWSSGSSQSLRDLEGGGVPFQNGKCSLTDFAAKVQPAKDSHVMWGDVEVRIYPIIPGDHPDCVQGPPVSSVDSQFAISDKKDSFHSNSSRLSLLFYSLRLRGTTSKK